MKQGFIFTLTDKGCFISFTKDKEIIADAFFPNPDGINDSKIGQLLVKHYTCPIVILLDTLNQSFFEETIPPANFYYKYRIINTIKSEHKNDSNAVLYYKKTKDIYQFSVAHLSNDNALWLSYINHLENPLDSVRSLPIETQVLLKITPQAKPLTIITYFDDYLGLRQCAFFHKQFYLSRLIPIKKADQKTAIGHETRNLIEYLKREESGIDDKDINIISLGDSKYYKTLDPRIHTHLDASNIQQLHKLKNITQENHFLSCLGQVIFAHKPKSVFQFDILKHKERKEFFHTLINGLTLGIIGFSLLYILGSASSFKTFMAGIPQLKQDITAIEKNIDGMPNGYPNNYSDSYRKIIIKIQNIFDKQADEIQTPLAPIEIVDKYISDLWAIQKIEWTIHSPKYVGLSLLDKAVIDKTIKYRSKPYFTMDLSLKFKGPRYQANDMFTALLSTPELRQFHIEKGEFKDGLFVLTVIERENK
tara:strand:- start:6527 stop:7957 length:1431 start_codon:yes stop_codon:yes gene_type:complete